ncbi:MAG: NPCBM/NEW2 domain-containing protein [Pirellulaceae bacterium]
MTKKIVASLALVVLVVSGWLPSERPRRASAQDPSTSSEHVPSAVMMEPLFGAPFQLGELVIDDDGLIATEQGDLHWTDFRSMHWTRNPVDPALDTFDVRLVGGGRVMAERIVMLDESIQLEWNGQRIAFPIEWFVGVINRDIAKGDQLQAATLDEDRVIVTLEDGQQEVDGLLEAMSVDGIEFSFEGNVRELPWNRVVSLSLATAGAEEAANGMRVTLMNGFTWFGTPVRMSASVLSLNVGGTELAIDATSIRSIEVVSDRMLQLADREPLQHEAIGLLLPPREFRRDASVLGSPLRVLVKPESGSPRYEEFRRGLGVPSGTTLVFDASGYDRFASLVGLDESSDGQADCEVVVELDGREVFRQRLAGSDPAIAVEVADRAAKTIDAPRRNGEGLELGDHVDFCDARLVRE